MVEVFSRTAKERRPLTEAGGLFALHCLDKTSQDQTIRVKPRLLSLFLPLLVLLDAVVWKAEHLATRNRTGPIRSVFGFRCEISLRLAQCLKAAVDRFFQNQLDKRRILTRKCFS